jgi:hypothetical protein
VWMIFWNSAVASIATGCVITKPRKCNDNIAACGKRTSPHDLGLQVNQASTYQHILPIYVPECSKVPRKIILDKNACAA